MQPRPLQIKPNRHVRKPQRPRPPVPTPRGWPAPKPKLPKSTQRRPTQPKPTQPRRQSPQAPSWPRRKLQGRPQPHCRLLLRRRHRLRRRHLRRRCHPGRALRAPNPTPTQILTTRRRRTGADCSLVQTPVSARRSVWDGRKADLPSCGKTGRPAELRIAETQRP